MNAMRACCVMAGLIISFIEELLSCSMGCHHALAKSIIIQVQKSLVRGRVRQEGTIPA